MLKILPKSKDAFIALQATGTLTGEDYDAVLPDIEKLIKKHGKVRVYIDMGSFDGWEMNAAWKDMAFGIAHWNDLEKLAIVGDAKWEEWTAAAANAMMHGTVRHFPVRDQADALEWAKAA
ncbi:MAG: STAS/SEC14 domain-containing protein [Rhodospirillaceae bacterium]|nr:STAS/SEC14 domain-containing protein [Rhodospirillaceae bacterium]